MTASDITTARTNRKASGSTRLTKVAALIAPPLIVLVFFMAAWVFAADVLAVPSYLLPSPSAIIEELSNVGLFFRHGSVTLIEAVSGFLLATLIGTSLALLMDLSGLLERAFMPYLILATNVPIVAFAPVAVIYFGFGMASKIVVAAAVTFFPIVIYTLKGLKSADVLLREMFYSNSASRGQTLIRLKVPTALPFVFAALKIAATASVLAAVVAEFIQASEGLGWLILTAAYVSDMARVWATVIVSSVIAISFYLIVGVIERWAIPWHSSMRGSQL